MNRIGSVAALSLVCAVVAGCGGSSGPSAQEKQFVAQANAICTQELAVLAKTPEPTSPTAAISYLPKALAIIQRQGARLSALNAPASKRAEVQAALASGQQLGTLLAGFLQKLRSGSFELATFSQVQSQSVTLRQQINAHFRKAGLTSCVTST
jgi:hypothetical protein